MRMKLVLAAATAALAAVAAASAGAAGGGIGYSFHGKRAATPSGGHLSITVEGGNRPALRALLGSSVAQTFTYGDKTEFLRWTNSVPKVVRAGDLQAGDYVRVNVRAPRGSSLATLESTGAGLIGDHGTELNRPDKPDYLFRGTVASVGSSSVSVARRQPARVAAPARQLPDADLHGRRLDDLPALAGEGSDCGEAGRPEGRRQGCDPRPRPGRLDAGPGRGHAGGQGGRARAGIERD